MDRSARTNWEHLARRWRIVEPLAPGAEDQAWYERQVAACEPRRALLLGVTARLATMRWPRALRLCAADWSLGMLAHLPPGSAAAVCADWRELPVANASIDIAIGDGCYSVVPGPENASLLNAEVRRVLRPGGTLLIRTFCRPAQPIVLNALFADLLAGRYPNLDLFRWLLAMAVQGQAPEGVALGEVWDAWSRHVPDAHARRERMGWTEDALANIERWQGSVFRYSFPALEELRGYADPYFDVAECDTPAYEWGSLFPRFAMRAR